MNTEKNWLLSSADKAEDNAFYNRNRKRDNRYRKLKKQATAFRLQSWGHSLFQWQCPQFCQRRTVVCFFPYLFTLLHLTHQYPPKRFVFCDCFLQSLIPGLCFLSSTDSKFQYLSNCWKFRPSYRRWRVSHKSHLVAGPAESSLSLEADFAILFSQKRKQHLYLNHITCHVTEINYMIWADGCRYLQKRNAFVNNSEEKIGTIPGSGQVTANVTIR